MSNPSISIESIEIELAILYRRITSFSLTMNNVSLDRSAYLLLHQIQTGGAIGVKALSEAVQLDISTVSRQAAALEQKGYVNRIQDFSDGRAYFLDITELGLQEYQTYRQQRISSLAQMLKDWPEEDCRKFSELLQKFNLESI